MIKNDPVSDMSPLAQFIHRIQNTKPPQKGIFSVCTAHHPVLENCVKFAAQNSQYLVLESTSNQVNHQGGYTGLTPKEFETHVRSLAKKFNLGQDRLLMGGDHLGPYPWRHLPAAQAMREAKAMVQEYVRAGFQKIHLDTSMPLGDDEFNCMLPPHLVASRAAALCEAAEEAATCSSNVRGDICYVIGTEVPDPGGVTGKHQRPHATSPAKAEETIEVTKEAFYMQDLQDAWDRVVAVVVQPGIEFGNRVIFDYQPHQTQELTNFIASYPNLVYEAHSTDFQTSRALKHLVRDAFAILKVGPWLTYTYRETMVALEEIEKEFLDGANIELSELQSTIHQVMLERPGSWIEYYTGDEQDQALDRIFSFSDRVRYYWTDDRLQKSVNRLISNLTANPPPLTLISQYLPRQYEKVRMNQLLPSPQDLIQDSIFRVLDMYHKACEQ